MKRKAILLCLSLAALTSCSFNFGSSSGKTTDSTGTVTTSDIDSEENKVFSLKNYFSLVGETPIANNVIEIGKERHKFDYCFNNVSFDSATSSIKVEKNGSIFNVDGFIGISQIKISYKSNANTKIELTRIENNEEKTETQVLSSNLDSFSDITLAVTSNPSKLKLIANDVLYIKTLEIEYTGQLDLSNHASKVTLNRLKEAYQVGDTFDLENGVSATATLSSSSPMLVYDETGINGYKLIAKDESNKEIDLSSPFEKEVTITIEAKYRSLTSNQIQIKINPKSIVLATSISLTPAEKTISVGQEFTLTATIAPEDTTDKTVTYVSKNSEVATVTSDGVVKGIKEGTTTIEATCNNVKATSTVTVTNSKGYYIGTTKHDVSVIDPYYAPSKGNQKLLFIPISIRDATYTWSQTYLDNIEKNIATIAYYYANASFNKLSLTGGIAGSMSKMYSSNYTESDFDGDIGNERLVEVMNAAVNWVATNFKDINLSDYDTNKDGYLDSVHFVFNGYTKKWGNALWPHMSTLDNNPGTSTPTIRSYSATSIGFINDAYTTIHEQGHIFGLEDYYDYAEGSTFSLLGGADMQDHNMFDWNSFSKFEMGWVNPYVIDGTRDEVTLKINPASSSGDCILISPSWNGTAFDEYILLELFTKVGNNNKDWSTWTTHYNGLGVGGIRLYHVDARLWGYNSANTFNNGGFVDDIDSNKYNYLQLANHNTSNNTDYATAKPSVIANSGYHLLQLIQASNKNTFETLSKSSSIPTTHLLCAADLFYTGHKFSIGEYSGYTDYGDKFFKNRTALNNGKKFPYVISFDKVTTTEATITIKKIA